MRTFWWISEDLGMFLGMFLGMKFQKFQKNLRHDWYLRHSGSFWLWCHVRYITCAHLGVAVGLHRLCWVTISIFLRTYMLHTSMRRNFVDIMGLIPSTPNHEYIMLSMPKLLMISSQEHIRKCYRLTEHDLKILEVPFSDMEVSSSGAIPKSSMFAWNFPL